MVISAIIPAFWFFLVPRHCSAGPWARTFAQVHGRWPGTVAVSHAAKKPPPKETLCQATGQTRVTCVTGFSWEVDRFDLICLMQLWLMHVEYVDGRYLKHYTGMYIYIYRIIKPTETLMSLAVSILITCLSWIIIGYGHWVFWIVIVAQVLQVVGLPSGIAVFA